MTVNVKKSLDEIASSFLINGVVLSCERHGNGNVNDTYLITCSANGEQDRYTLQRINHHVFPDPEGLMQNFEKVTSHLLKKSIEQNHGKEVLCLIPTKKGLTFHLDGQGNFWRMTKFIPGGRSFEVPENDRHAYEAAKSFGSFQADLADLDASSLVETIPDFHNTKKRLERLKEIREEDPVNRLREVSELADFAIQNQKLASTINSSDFPTRIVHNDTKLNNVLLHKSTGEGMCVVDLDTVMPGCALHDFGDLVRTAASSALEDEVDVSKMKFLPNRFAAILDGYLDGSGEMLLREELNALPMAPIVITYELGVRFLTDFLEGDVYFKITRENHNKHRARAQFALVQSMLDSFDDMKGILEQKLKSIGTY